MFTLGRLYAEYQHRHAVVFLWKCATIKLVIVKIHLYCSYLSTAVLFRNSLSTIYLFIYIIILYRPNLGLYSLSVVINVQYLQILDSKVTYCAVIDEE